MVNINDDKRAAYAGAKVLFQPLLRSGYPSEELLKVWLAHGPPRECARTDSRMDRYGDHHAGAALYVATDQLGQVERFINDVLPLLRLK